MFHAKFISGESFEHPVSKVVCVGRNYAEHALELNNPVPDAPILFIKPETSVVSLSPSFSIPTNDCHYEAEIAILIGKQLSNVDASSARSGIAGIGLALDLTRRELQAELKQKRHPWELAKAFDGACPVSEFVPFSKEIALDEIRFSFSQNGELKQQGVSSDMITPIIQLLIYISRYFTLRPGDIVLTGTPKGVGTLAVNDSVELNLMDKLSVHAHTIKV